MNPNTGEIYEGTDEELAQVQKKLDAQAVIKNKLSAQIVNLPAGDVERVREMSLPARKSYAGRLVKRRADAARRAKRKAQRKARRKR